MLAALFLAHPLQQPEEPAPPPAPARLTVVERLLLTVPEEFSIGTLDPGFAPGGARVAFKADLDDGRAVVFSEGAVSEPHDFVHLPKFSADGQHVAWVWGNRIKKDREEWELMLDGKRAKKADWIGAVVFAPVGSDYAVWTGEDVRIDGDGDYAGGEYTCSWGKRKADGYSDAPWQDPQWSADGKHLGFIAVKPSRMMAVMDGKEFGPYSLATAFTWSTDGKSAAWSARENYERTLIYSGKKSYGQEYESVGAPALGPGGAMAFLASTRGKRVLIFRDESVPGFYDDLGTPCVSADGKQVVVAANNGRKIEGSGWFFDNSWMDGAVVWKEDEAAVAKAGSVCFLVLNGNKLGADWWRVVRPFFSPDTRHVAARARNADGWQVLLDDRASPAYDRVDALRFSDDGKFLEFGARRGRELLWVRIAID